MQCSYCVVNFSIYTASILQIKSLLQYNVNYNAFHLVLLLKIQQAILTEAYKSKNCCKIVAIRVMGNTGTKSHKITEQNRRNPIG